jgi:uncharacterized iron-regulated membrane protein
MRGKANAKGIGRRTFLLWHRRIGLALAPLVLMQALTGLALLLSPMDSPPDSSALLPPSRYIAAAERAMPSMHVFRLDYPKAGPVTARLSGASGETGFVLLGRAAADVVDQGPIWHFPRKVAQEWHFSLLAGRVGASVVGVEAIGLVVLAMTGIGFWWPAKGAVLRALAIPSRAPQRLRLRLWHRTTGVLASGILVMMAITGLLLAWPIIAPPAPPNVRHDRALPIDAAAHLAQAAMNGQALRDIRLAANGHATFHFAAHSANVWDLDTFYLSPQAHISRAADAPALWMRVLPLHTGDALGTIGTLGIALFALALIFIVISGVVSWLRTTTGKKP